MLIKCNIRKRVIEVEDANGIPLDIFWRKRLKDATIDGNCEVVDANDVIKLPLTNIYVMKPQ